MDSTVEAVRTFNRFHTRFTGALNHVILGGPFSLIEARVLYELASRHDTLASDLCTDLGVDPGYLSRLLAKFERHRWIERGTGVDRRQRPINLTAAGRRKFEALDHDAAAEIAERVEHLGPSDRTHLRGALADVRDLLEIGTAGYRIREFRAGDMGLVISRQAIVYEEQFGWDSEYEALVAEICARFLKEFKPGREQCWIAGRGGRIAGSVFLMDAGEGVGQLRLLYVEPSARGLGIGSDLVRRCMEFARAAGYAKMRLWTNDVLVSARRIYEAHGFTLVSAAEHRSFGKDLVGQVWECDLAA